MFQPNAKLQYVINSPFGSEPLGFSLVRWCCCAVAKGLLVEDSCSASPSNSLSLSVSRSLNGLCFKSSESSCHFLFAAYTSSIDLRIRHSFRQPCGFALERFPQLCGTGQLFRLDIPMFPASICSAVTRRKGEKGYSHDHDHSCDYAQKCFPAQPNLAQANEEIIAADTKIAARIEKNIAYPLLLCFIIYAFSPCDRI